ncbi:MAG TPA: hypothetical protein PK156_38335, partial [Polyangium sp.]|nr:hypothetical protein [Polyangium sp.]
VATHGGTITTENSSHEGVAELCECLISRRRGGAPLFEPAQRASSGCRGCREIEPRKAQHECERKDDDLVLERQTFALLELLGQT